MKHLQVDPPNKQWGDDFLMEAEKIRNCLGDRCIDVHHVGSTSVPDLCAKPIIDIIVVFKDPSACIKLLSKIGYLYKGPYNIPRHFGFSKRERINVNLHGYEKGHPEIELNLCFRDYLRAHPEVREAYGALKRNLIKIPDSFEKKDSFFRGYTLGKYEFIQEVLHKAGFCQPRILLCSHPHEWKFVQLVWATYAPHLPPPFATEANASHVVFYRGGTMNGYAYVRVVEESEGEVKILMTPLLEDKQNEDEGSKSIYIKLVKDWLHSEGKSKIRILSSRLQDKKCLKGRIS